MSQRGLDPAAFSLESSWTEQAPGQPGAVIVGHRFRSNVNPVAFDLYTTLDGEPLVPDQLEALGLAPKQAMGPARQQPAETPQPTAADAAKPKPEARARKTAARHVVKLAALDSGEIAKAKAERAESGAKGGELVGLVRSLPTVARVTDTSAGFGEWVTAADGSRIWAASIEAAGAVAQRVHLAGLRVPAGVQVVAYDAGDPSEIYGPIDGGEEDIWLPSCFAEVVAVECQVPAGASGVEFEIGQTAHIFKNYAESAGGVAPGGCNLDFACYPDWGATGTGVAGFGSIYNLYVLMCTGSLIVDTNPDSNIPYFLTANHCLSTQSAATNAEFYWLYQNATCGGTPPSTSSVPRTSGADYLAGSGGNGLYGGGSDFTLMRLRMPPPAGLTWLGWSTVSPAVGTPVTVIHHPRGSYKRISFAQKQSYGGSVGDYYHKVVYTEGTTEPGSSGSPLFISATQQIIGQLWGGYASCDQPLEPDYFGRLDVTFPLIAQWLDPNSYALTLNFAEHEISVEEGATAEVTLMLNTYAGAAVGADYALVAGTARPDIDYVPVAGSVSFEGTGPTTFTFQVQAPEDFETEAPKTVLVALSNPRGILSIGFTNPATITIADNDPDSDGDTLSDHEETHGLLGWFTDPNDPDSDDDGLTDAQEVRGMHGYFPSPLDPNTDDDPWTDYEELTGDLLTDPTEYTVLPALSVPWFTNTRR